MADDVDAWIATVEKKSRGLLDGSNLYRRLTIRIDDGRTMKIRVDRVLWTQIEVGDRIAKDPGEAPRRV